MLKFERRNSAGWVVSVLRISSILAVWPRLGGCGICLSTGALEFRSLGGGPLAGFLTYLKYSATCLFSLSVDLVVHDRPECFSRFFVSYVVRSPSFGSLAIVRAQASEVVPLLSCSQIYFGLGWCEREAFDMFGLVFLNHGDLRRILTDYGFLGFPLRRDFPLSGFSAWGYSVGYSCVLQTVNFLLLHAPSRRLPTGGFTDI